jgi:hypothetical protein
VNAGSSTDAAFCLKRDSLPGGGEQAFPPLNAPQNDVQQLQTPLLAMPTEIGRSGACAETPTSARRATFTGNNLQARFDIAQELQSAPQHKKFTIEYFLTRSNVPPQTMPHDAADRVSRQK